MFISIFFSLSFIAIAVFLCFFFSFFCSALWAWPHFTYPSRQPNAGFGEHHAACLLLPYCMKLPTNKRVQGVDGWIENLTLLLWRWINHKVLYGFNRDDLNSRFPMRIGHTNKRRWFSTMPFCTGVCIYAVSGFSILNSFTLMYYPLLQHTSIHTLLTLEVCLDQYVMYLTSEM